MTERPRVALVTGGARRIGAAIARMLAADGWRVVIHCNASRAEAESLAAELGHGAFVVAADLAQQAGIEAVVPTIVEQAGGLDLVVNNASAFRYDDIATLTWDSLHAHLTPNLVAPLFLVRDLARLPAGPYERIAVNILDEKVENVNPDFLSYTASKVALAGMTQTLAMACAGTVRVNGIAPGLTLRSGKQTDEAFARGWRATPLGRGPMPEEIATAVAFVVATRSFSGQVLVLDGGIGLVKRTRDVAFEDADEA